MELMTTSEQIRTLLTAQDFGGNFAKHLAAAGLVADVKNRQIIFEAFPWLVESYGPNTPFYAMHTHDNP